MVNTLKDRLSQHRQLVAVLGVLLPLLVIEMIMIMHSIAYRRFVIDDAYISFRYAENFAQGHGLVFNPGERVEGYSDFLWVVLLSAMFKLGLNTELAAKLLGVTANASVILALYLISSSVKAPEDKSAFSRYISAFLVAMYPGFAVWGVGGLETGLFTALLTWSLSFFVWWVQHSRVQAGLLFALFLALASLTRPEGPLFFLLGIATVIVFEYAHHRQLWRAIHHVAFPVIFFGSIVGAHLLWRYVYYGYPLPNTYYLKVVSRAGRIPISRGYWYISGFWKTIGGWWLFWIPVSLLVTRKREAWVWYCWACLFAWLYYLHRVNGDWMPQYRFFIPVLPLIYLLVQETLGDLVTGLKTSALPRLNNVGVMFLVVLLGWTLLNAIYTWRNEQPSPPTGHIEVGLWLRRNAPKDSVIAVTNAGAISYYSKLRVIDYYGLVNSHIAHNPAKVHMLDLGDGNERPYLLRLDVNWLLDQRPDFIEIPGRVVNGKLVTYAPLAGLIWESDRFHREYDGPVYGTLYARRK